MFIALNLSDRSRKDLLAAADSTKGDSEKSPSQTPGNLEKLREDNPVLIPIAQSSIAARSYGFDGVDLAAGLIQERNLL